MNIQAQQFITNAKAVIFDMDGVIIDSIPLYIEAKYRFLEKHGIGKEQIQPFNTLGMGTKDILELFQEKLGLQGDIHELANQWREELYLILLAPGNLILIDGVDGFIQQVHNSKPLAIATGGHQKEMAKQLMELVGLDTYFKEIISSDDVKKGKPAPDVYLFTAKKLGIDPKDCLVIEDAANGTIAAKSAGMKVIGVNKDENHRKQLQEAGADVVVESLRDLV